MTDEPSPNPTGILVINKALRHTSAAVCRNIKAKLRRGGATKRVKVGHGGTLDPLATGVLIILIGKATRLSNQVMGGAKSYRAEVDLSRVSPTDDLEVEPAPVEIRRVPTDADVRAACARFVGPAVLQVPPAHSAMRIDGKRAYQAARAGETPTLEPRPVRIDRVELTRFDWPIAAVEIDCGKGTYIRSFARDLGAALGTGGVLTALERTRVGACTIEAARRVDDLPDELSAADLASPEDFGLALPSPRGS